MNAWVSRSADSTFTAWTCRHVSRSNPSIDPKATIAAGQHSFRSAPDLIGFGQVDLEVTLVSDDHDVVVLRQALHDCPPIAPAPPVTTATL
jgi:hypothetical protein